MSGVTVEWIAMLLFLVLFAAAVVAEIFWLIKKQWASAGKAVAFVLATDLISFTVGSIIVFVIFFVLIMMTFGPAGRGSTAPESAYVVVSLIGLIFPPILLILSKRLFLWILKIKTGKAAWIYTIVTSLLLLVVVLIPPPLLLYISSYFVK